MYVDDASKHARAMAAKRQNTIVWETTCKHARPARVPLICHTPDLRMAFLVSFPI